MRRPRLSPPATEQRCPASIAVASGAPRDRAPALGARRPAMSSMVGAGTGMFPCTVEMRLDPIAADAVGAYGRLDSRRAVALRVDQADLPHSRPRRLPPRSCNALPDHGLPLRHHRNASMASKGLPQDCVDTAPTPALAHGHIERGGDRGSPRRRRRRRGAGTVGDDRRVSHACSGRKGRATRLDVGGEGRKPEGRGALKKRR